MKHLKKKPKDGLYYDLIKVPHGHIPAGLFNLWSRFPIPIKDIRDWNYYYCPFCGAPSFFKGLCRYCEDDLEGYLWQYYRRRRRREYFRNLWKHLEYLILPVLVLFGKAYYVHSKIRHYSDYILEETPKWI